MENDFDIKNHTTFKIGGKIKEVYFPKTTDEFVQILKSNCDIKVLGNLSDTLVSSDGYNGKVVLTKELNACNVLENYIEVECGMINPKLAQIACDNCLSGFEFMIGFPGTVGGNIFMNASASNQSISDKLISVECFDGNSVKIFSKNELQFGYRHSICGEKKLVVLSAKFMLDKKSKSEIQNVMKNNLEFRKTHQPLLSLPNCGSVFKNPENNSAGKLLDLIGAKSFSCGGAKVWENHANFIVNSNNATSMDVLTLIDKMQTKVYEEFGIKLLPEIKFLGNINKDEVELCKKLQIELI